MNNISTPQFFKDFTGSIEDFRILIDNLSRGTADHDKYGNPEEQLKLLKELQASFVGIHPTNMDNSTHPSDLGEWFYYNHRYYPTGGGSGSLRGTQGTQGTRGIQGTEGVQGVPGIQGIQGMEGVQGVPGIQGSQGCPGMIVVGVVDYKGKIGVQGTQGTQDNILPDTQYHVIEIAVYDGDENLTTTNDTYILSESTVYVSNNESDCNTFIDNMITLHGSGHILNYDVIKDLPLYEDNSDDHTPTPNYWAYRILSGYDAINVSIQGDVKGVESGQTDTSFWVTITGIQGAQGAIGPSGVVASTGWIDSPSSNTGLVKPTLRLTDTHPFNDNIAVGHAPVPEKIYLPDNNNETPSRWYGFPVIVPSNGQLLVALPKTMVDTYINDMINTDKWNEYISLYDHNE